MRMIDPFAFTVKPIPKDRFSHDMAHFFIARATSDTSKHDYVHDSGYFIWFYIVHTYRDFI